MKPVKIFIYAAGGILLAAALIRFVIAAGHASVLSLPEPILGIPLRYAILLVGAFELLVALISLFGKQTGLQLGSLAWLATNFMVYRIGLLTMHCHPQATCIGSLTDPLQLSRGMSGSVIEFMTLNLLLGSYAALLWQWLERAGRFVHSSGRKAHHKFSPHAQTNSNLDHPQPVATIPVRTERRQEALVRTLKIACTKCGGHIEFPTNFFGERIPCPHCQTSIILAKAAILKMSCLACDGRIAFPAHALGQTISCPHCNRDLILKEPA